MDVKPDPADLCYLDGTPRGQPSPAKPPKAVKVKPLSKHSSKKRKKDKEKSKKHGSSKKRSKKRARKSGRSRKETHSQVFEVEIDRHDIYPDEIPGAGELVDPYPNCKRLHVRVEKDDKRLAPYVAQYLARS
jgi:hypothetical protein